VIRFRDLPIIQKVLGVVAISVLPALVLSCVALLAFARYRLGATLDLAALAVPMAVICTGSTILVLLLVFRLLRVALGPTPDLLRDLKSANGRAESASAARSEFLAAMSHEMRTPLHAILSFAELGGQRAASLTPEKAARYYKLIEEGGKRLLDLLNDVVDLANLEAGKRVLRFSSLPVESVVRGVVDELRPLFQSRGVALEATLCEATSGWIDREALTQVLRSVLTNAATTSGPGGTVAVALARSGSGLLFSVAHRGSGVARAEQGPAPVEIPNSGGPKSEARSSGLKLALCRGIMTAHGGRIWAERDGSGETVYLEIPDRNPARHKWPTPVVLLSGLLLAFQSTAHAPSALAATKRPQPSAQGSALAFTPDAIWSRGQIVTRLGLRSGAIYLIDCSAPTGGGRIVGDPKKYWAYDAKISPTGDLVAFHGGTTASGADGADEGIGVIDMDGAIVAFIRMGVDFAWSLEGTRLAVALSRMDPFGSSGRRGLVVWDRRHGSTRTFEALPSRVGWASEDSLFLQLGDRVDVIDPRSGVRARVGHHGTRASPDGLYSIRPGGDGQNTKIVEDETGLDVTSRLFGPLERKGLHEIRSAFWVCGGGSDHFMCVSGSEHVYGDDPLCMTAIIDAGTGETIAEFPGEAIGPTSDGKVTVVLRHETDRLEAVNLEEMVRRWFRGGESY